MPLVSRRFVAACREPSVWPELRVLHSALGTEERWRGFLRWLAARASGLQTLVFGADTDRADSGEEHLGGRKARAIRFPGSIFKETKNYSPLIGTRF